MITFFPDRLTPPWAWAMFDLIFERDCCEFELPEEFIPLGWEQNDCYRAKGHAGRHLVLLSHRADGADDVWAVVS